MSADKEQVREHVETILRRWGNDLSKTDGRTARYLAGDIVLGRSQRAAAIDAIVALVTGSPPHETPEGCPWWEDVNPRKAGS